MRNRDENMMDNGEKMPRRFGVRWIGGTIAIVGMATFSWFIASRSPETSTSLPTDPQNTRWLAMQRKDAHAFGHTKKSVRKTRGPITAEISSDVPNAGEPGYPFHLRARIDLKVNIAELHYRFDLPEDIRLLEGESEGVIQNARAGEAQEIEVRLESTSRTRRRIHFSVWKMEGGEAIGNSASYYTNENQMIEGLKYRDLQGPNAPRSREDFLKRHIQ